MKASGSISIIFLLLICAFNYVQADCNACAYNGDCSAAYRGSPGQYCGVTAGKTCCCPQSAQCAASPYDCRCRAIPAPVRPSTSSGSVIGTIASIIFLSLLAFCICKCCCNDNEHVEYQQVPVTQYAQPVYANQQYAAQQPVYGQQPVYAQQPGYAVPPQPVVYHTYQTGYDSGAGVAVGTVAGLAAGVAIGEAMSHDHDSGYGGYNSTFAGDSGDNTFAGDTGDSGDTFAGDF